MESLVKLPLNPQNGAARHNGSGPKARSQNEELTTLALAAAGGNYQAYETLVEQEKFLEGVTRTSRWICRGSSIQAEELLSEFFLCLPKKILKYSNKNAASILSWSSGVLRNLHIDLLRRRWREDDRVECLDLMPVECERAVDTADSRAALNQAFNTLTQREKQLLALRWREETLDDIVAAIDNLSDPKDIRNRRPRISRELKAVEQKLREALVGMSAGQLQGQKGPLKIDY